MRFHISYVCVGDSGLTFINVNFPSWNRGLAGRYRSSLRRELRPPRDAPLKPLLHPSEFEAGFRPSVFSVLDTEASLGGIEGHDPVRAIMVTSSPPLANGRSSH